MRTGRQLPQRILNAPTIEFGLEFFYLAFVDLCTTRSEGPISWLVIQEYADRLGLSSEMREDLHHHVRMLDSVMQEHLKKKRPQSPGAPGADPHKNRDTGRRSRTRQ